MSIRHIRGENFRCFENFFWEFSPSVNWFYGDNASGKTSFLEAMYWMVSGRSFRIQELKTIIRWDAPYARLHAQFQNMGDVVYDLTSLRYASGRTQVRIDQASISRWSDIVLRQPVMFVDAHTHRQFSEQVDVRRRWLDWMMFYIRPSYRETLLAYRKAMDQRMMALKNLDDPSPWEFLMCQHASLLEQERDHVMRDLSDLWSTSKGLAEEVALKLFKGYEGACLEKCLYDQRVSDLRRGYAQSGPHRFDVHAVVGERMMDHCFSLGQQKLIVAELMLMAARFVLLKTGKKSLWLMDDLGSELDEMNRDKLVSSLKSMGFQCIMTSLDCGWGEAYADPVPIRKVYEF